MSKLSNTANQSLSDLAEFISMPVKLLNEYVKAQFQFMLDYDVAETGNNIYISQEVKEILIREFGDTSLWTQDEILQHFYINKTLFDELLSKIHQVSKVPFFLDTQSGQRYFRKQIFSAFDNYFACSKTVPIFLKQCKNSISEIKVNNFIINDLDKGYHYRIDSKYGLVLFKSGQNKIQEYFKLDYDTKYDKQQALKQRSTTTVFLKKIQTERAEKSHLAAEKFKYLTEIVGLKPEVAKSIIETHKENRKIPKIQMV